MAWLKVGQSRRRLQRHRLLHDGGCLELRNEIEKSERCLNIGASIRKLRWEQRNRSAAISFQTHRKSGHVIAQHDVNGSRGSAGPDDQRITCQIRASGGDGC